MADNQFSEWLREKIDRLDLTYAAFGEKVGVKHSSVSQWVSGKHLPEPMQLRRIAEITDTDEVWLFRLVGYLSPEGEGETPAEVAAKLSPAAKALLAEISNWDDSDIMAIVEQARRIIGPLIKRHKEKS